MSHLQTRWQTASDNKEWHQRISKETNSHNRFYSLLCHNVIKVNDIKNQATVVPIIDAYKSAKKPK
jgi:hypothetical protein